MRPEPRCRGCGKPPSQLAEYVERYKEDAQWFDSPADIVRRDEGTYNRETNSFLCTTCYYRRGMPLGTA